MRRTILVVLASALGCQGVLDGDGTDQAGGPGEPDDGDPRMAECRSLAATGDPALDGAAIRSCLADVGEAVLAPGEYWIDRPIDMPASALLRGADPASRPVLRLLPGHGANYMLAFAQSSPADRPARVADVNLDAHGGIDNPANQAIVLFSADNAIVERADVFSEAGSQPAGRQLPASIYFICDTCRGGEARQVRMFGNFYGVIFRGQNADAANRVAESEIFANQCDPITFSGYGVAEGNWIHDNGWDCANGPIPGGGIYTLTNPAGGVIRGNTIERTCGHGLDLDRAANLVIEDNNVSQPGFQFGGAAPWCGWASGALLHGLRDSVIRRNQFSADGARNRVGPGGYDIYAAFGQPMFSDLPAGGDSVVGVIFSEPRDGGEWSSERNVVEDNAVQAACGPDEGCVGVGLFASRGTGYAGVDWSAATTNYFTGNRTFGSNVGSVRCGGNWFAGNSDCPAGAPSPCNDDDYQHGAGDFRNDGCSFY